jgi:hypothetical protein
MGDGTSDGGRYEGEKNQGGILKLDVGDEE